MSNLNHFICPTCGHDFYSQCAYATCDGCQTFFYVSHSRTCQRPQMQVLDPPDSTGVSFIGGSLAQVRKAW